MPQIQKKEFYPTIDDVTEKINEIIEVLNKKEEITVTIPKGEYNIWGNNPEIQKDYISKKDIEKFEEENPDEIISYKDFKKHFNLN